MKTYVYKVIALTLLSMTACTQVPEWTLFYYPDQSSLPQAELNSDDINGYYQSAEQCQKKALGMRRLSQSGSGAYQCGHLCQLDEAGKLTCKVLTQ